MFSQTEIKEINIDINIDIDAYVRNARCTLLK